MRNMGTKVKRKGTAIIFMCIITFLIMVLSACSNKSENKNNDVDENERSEEKSTTSDDLNGKGQSDAVNNADEKLIITNEEEQEIIESDILAPDFEIKQINPNNEKDVFTLSDFEGKGVIIYVWLGPTITFGEVFSNLEELYKDNSNNLEIIAVSYGADEKELQEFMKENYISFSVANDKQGQLLDLYQIRKVPSIMFIDQTGNITDTVIGELTAEKLNEFWDEINS